MDRFKSLEKNGCEAIGKMIKKCASNAKKYYKEIELDDIVKDDKVDLDNKDNNEDGGYRGIWGYLLVAKFHDDNDHHGHGPDDSNSNKSNWMDRICAV